MELDTDLRWHLLTALARVDAVDGDDIDAELERDPTDMGRRHAETARAIRPHRHAKQAAWDQLLDDTDISLAIARNIWGGFQQLSQPTLMAHWVEPYFEALDRVWSERSLDFTLEFSSGMFPHGAASEELLARVDAYLGRDDLDAPLRRTLLEERDTLVRTLRARATDARA